MNQTLPEIIAAFTAKRAHADQVDKAGAPYIEHVLRVADAMPTVDGRIVALLHDVLEDSVFTAVDLGYLGFEPHIVEAVVLMTRQPGQSRDDYISGLMGNALATAVKLADLADNMNLTRLPAVTEKDLARNEMYARDAARLRGGLPE